jgi:hypothetical protein
MCDYSLHASKNRPAVVGDKLVTHQFNNVTRGFRAADDSAELSSATAVCLLPGTEVAFDAPVETSGGKIHHPVAIFRKVEPLQVSTHHDALEFPDGKIVKLTDLMPGQSATVLQMPVAEPITETEKQKGTQEPVRDVLEDIWS